MLVGESVSFTNSDSASVETRVDAVMPFYNQYNMKSGNRLNKWSDGSNAFGSTDINLANSVLLVENSSTGTSTRQNRTNPSQPTAPRFTEAHLWTFAVVPTQETGGAQTTGVVHCDLTSKMHMTLCVPAFGNYDKTEDWMITKTQDKIIMNQPYKLTEVSGDLPTTQADLDLLNSASTLGLGLNINDELKEFYSGTFDRGPTTVEGATHIQ